MGEDGVDAVVDSTTEESMSPMMRLRTAWAGVSDRMESMSDYTKEALSLIHI